MTILVKLVMFRRFWDRLLKSVAMHSSTRVLPGVPPTSFHFNSTFGGAAKGVGKATGPSCLRTL